MWREVDRDNTRLMECWCRIIRSMNGDYAARMDVGELLRNMGDEQGCTWYYDGNGFDIALRFHYVPKRDQYQLANIGFLGDVEPEAVLELAIEKCTEFLRARGKTHFFALRPKGMDHPGIERFHQLVPDHPKIDFAIEQDWREMMLCRVGPRELLTEKSPGAAAPQTVGASQLHSPIQSGP